jgi:hypothetical protein
VAGQRELAREVRAGLTVIQGNKDQKSQKVEIDPLDTLYYRKPIRQHVKEFGALFAAILLAIAALRLYRDRPLNPTLIIIGIASIFAFLGYMVPAILHPFWKGWMKFAQVLGLIMTTLLLSIAWMIVLIPVSLAMRAMRVRVMNMGFRQNVESYWETRADKLHDFKLLDRQF